MWLFFFVIAFHLSVRGNEFQQYYLFCLGSFNFGPEDESDEFVLPVSQKRSRLPIWKGTIFPRSQSTEKIYGNYFDMIERNIYVYVFDVYGRNYLSWQIKMNVIFQMYKVYIRVSGQSGLLVHCLTEHRSLKRRLIW
jgi:hypothetical protein